jgi:hypothetical protein
MHFLINVITDYLWYADWSVFVLLVRRKEYTVSIDSKFGDYGCEFYLVNNKSKSFLLKGKKKKPVMNYIGVI